MKLLTSLLMTASLFTFASCSSLHADHSCCSKNKECREGNCKKDKSCCDNECNSCSGEKGDCGKNCDLKKKS